MVDGGHYVYYTKLAEGMFVCTDDLEDTIPLIPIDTLIDKVAGTKYHGMPVLDSLGRNQLAMLCVYKRS